MQSRSWLLSLLGFRHGLCVAATTLRQQSVFRCLDVVLLRTHNDLVGWAQEVDMCLCGDIPAMNIIGFALISCTTVNPLGGLLSVWPCACARNVWRSSADPVPRRPIPVSGLPGSIELCAGANACLGLIGRNVCPRVVGSMVRSPNRPPRGRGCLCPPVSASILFRCPHLPSASTFF